MGRISKVRITPTTAELYASHLELFPPLRPGERLGVNKRFWKMLAAVLRIAFPSKTGKEAFLLVLHTFFLVLRTILSVMVARLDGRIVRDLVNKTAGIALISGHGRWKRFHQGTRLVVRPRTAKHIHKRNGKYC